MRFFLKYAAAAAVLTLPLTVAAQGYEGIASARNYEGTPGGESLRAVPNGESYIAVSNRESFTIAPKYDSFMLPLEQAQPPQLSSGFGEHRVTRFHTGLDFRTGGVEGVRVRSVADGYICRIAIAPWGYGKVVYVQHPDGVQTVYAHLRDFTPELEEYIKAERYRRRSNAVDIYPARGVFPVKKGQLLGYSGNTGNSFGPHLHFEVRDGATGRTLSPILLGIYDIEDTITPTIVAVSYYVVDTLAGVPIHTLAGRYPAAKSPAGTYTLSGNVKAPGKGYYTVEALDRKNNVGFNMAIYRITERIDGQVRFEYLMDGLTFSQNGYAKTIGVYAENRKSRNDIIRLAVQDGGSGLPFYRNVRDGGLVNPERDGSVEIEVADDNGNVSVLRFEMEYAPELYEEAEFSPSGAEVLDAGRDFVKNSGGVSVSIPARALYESILYSHYELTAAPTIVKSQSGSVLSPFYAVHTDDVPLHSAFTLSIGADVSEELRAKVVLARVAGGGKAGHWLAATAAKYKDGYVTARVGSFGVWCVAADTKSPTIGPSFGSGADLSGVGSISFSIADDLSGVASYRAEIDGHWVILEHNVVKNRLIHNFDDALTGRGKTHDIKLTVVDGVGNTAVYEGTYFR